MMTNALKQHVQNLHLSGLLNSLELRLQEAEANRLPYAQFLELLLQDEINVRDQRMLARRRKSADFREPRSLENFDFSFNPGINRAQIYELATSHFVRQHRDVLLVGPPGAAQGQLFWFLLCSGNRVDRLAASHEHYAPPVQVRIRHKRCPLRATPIYSVSTLSWLRSALKRLPSFALDSCSLVTSLSGLKPKNLLLPTPSINCESVEIRFVTAGFAEKSLNHPLPKHLRPV
jgi:hypothetical protein